MFKNILTLIFGCFLTLILGQAIVCIAAIYSPVIYFYSSISSDIDPRFFNTLDEFLASKSFILKPHSRFMGCYTNKLGFYDAEPSGAEIIGLGDSFVFGRVSYPENILRLVELALTDGCRREIKIAKFGVPGAGMHEYEDLVRLILQEQNPKIILLHLYLGNDFPSQGALDRAEQRKEKQHGFFTRVGSKIRHLRLFRFLRNIQRAWTSAQKLPTIETSSYQDKNVEGGSCLPLTETEQKLNESPAMDEESWFRVVGMEAERIYRPVPENTPPRIKDLDQFSASFSRIAEMTKRRGVSLIAILYPSQFQLNDQLRAWYIRQSAVKGVVLRSNQFDPAIPEQAVKEVAEKYGIPIIAVSEALNPPNKFYAVRDTHWNSIGNLKAAEKEATELQRLICPSGTANP